MRRLVVVMVSALLLVGVASGVGADPGPYEQVVDNSMKDRFAASEGWKKGSRSDGHYGRDYHFARPGKEGLAKFKIKIPETGDYVVYARWPENLAYNKETPVGIKTASGMEWERVDQRRGADRWVEIGTYELEAGDDYYIRLSRDSEHSGYLAADAVKVVEAPDLELTEEFPNYFPLFGTDSAPVLSGSGASCSNTGHEQPHVAEIGCHLQEKFGVEVYNYHGAGDHAAGLALDLMVYNDTATGDAIADYLLANQDDLGVASVIWQQRYNDGSGWTMMEDRGSPGLNHYDHVHASFSER